MTNGKSVDTDVIIIGGGPSGSAAAIWAGLNNLRVILFESHKFPRHKPGETLHPGIEIIFKQLDVLNEVIKLCPLRHNGILLKNQNHTTLSEYGEDDRGKWSGFQIMREDLDSILLNKLQSLDSVRVLQPCKVNKIIQKDEKIVGVETNKGTFTSKFLIDASGSRKWLSRQLKSECVIFSKPLFVTYGYHENIHKDTNLDLPVFEFLENGWIWKARIANNLFHWTHLSIGRKPSIIESTQQSKCNYIKARAADVTWKFNYKCAENRYFLCGDSCATLDPSSSKGVLRAMYSGVLASNTILKIINNEIEENIGYISYRQLMESWFIHDKNILESFYNENGINVGL